MKKLILRAMTLTLTVMLLASCALADTIKFRDEGDQVLVLQTALFELGYYTGELDGKFGTGTRKAVKAFQKAEGLKVDGLAGTATQAKLTELTGAVFEEDEGAGEEEAPETQEKPKTLFAGDYRMMQLGNGGTRVRVLQRALLALGFDVTVDGSYGAVTNKAVRAFQTVVGLTADGKAGKKTLQKLEGYFDEEGNCTSGPIAGNEPAEPEVDPNAPVYGIPTRTLRFGDKGEDVRYTMHRLYDLEYYNKTVDDKFGTGMFKALKAFQRKNGLTADGVAGPKTIEALFSSNALDADDPVPGKEEEKVKLPLKRGDSGEAVKAVQVRLTALGYYTGNLDGKFGAGTQTAVRLFQARNALTVDGKVGQRTLDKLGSESAVPANGAAQ